VTTVGTSGRSAGVDLARGVALLGIMAVHIFPPLQSDGSIHPAFQIDSGRFPALFPLLAGVGLALAYGGRRPPRGAVLWQDRAGVVARAALLVVLGVLLGRVDSAPLVILLDFGLMFLGATFFLGLSTRALWLLSAVWVVAVPLLSFKVRTGPAGLAGSPDLPGPAGLAQPLVDHALASSYPVLPWLGYVLVGLALGRGGIEGRSRHLQMVLVGAAIAVAAKVASWAALAAAGGADELNTNVQGLRLVSVDLRTQLEVGLTGTTPTTDWRWLLVSAPHSGTTLDLLHTGGAAVAILGVCLLVVDRWGRRAVLPLVAVGSMTLSLYSAHVLALWRQGPLLLDDPLVLYLAHIVVAILVAWGWRSYVGRGPLEWLSARCERFGRSAMARLLGRTGQVRTGDAR
jgi:uncharacterized membrane protein